ncbi:MAG: 4-alpha-glucanotransferase [Simkania sp.]|nr:4-alpha-glucanotransferase [Simkania sp.]
MTFERESLLQTPAATAWRKIGTQPHHGIDVFLSALHSKNSLGIGEYLDLIPVIHWCKEVGFDVVQLLPLNDSGFDPSPYNALSSCALNPIYLSLHCLPLAESSPHLLEKLESLKPYSLLPRVAYRDVLSAKIKWLREYLEIFKTELLTNHDYQTFKAGHPWVETYALFKALKEHFDQASWETWPTSYQHFDAVRRTALLEEFKEPIEFYTVLQYFSFLQLKEVRTYAETQQVLIEGDIPILVSRDSADVWQAPQFFDLTLAAGAPPDTYTLEGQYWGFPIFNWEIMRQDDYRFWRERLNNAAEFYHLYRIDHAVGFFKIWAIPLNEPSSKGSFISADESHWIPQGEHILNVMLASSDMLPLAEDLGAVPDQVRTCLTQLGIPGTKVIRWEREYTTTKNYIPYNKYPLLSLTCVSTHDSETLTLWWDNNPEESKAFAKFKGWTYATSLDYDKRLDILRDSHGTPSLFHINLLQEYFALFPELVAEDPNEERINIPGRLQPTNWTYRYHTNIDTWTTHKPLHQALRTLLHKQ